jgi:hypothetical protein
MFNGHPRVRVAVALTGFVLFADALACPAASVSVTNQVRTDTVTAGTVQKSSSAPDNNPFNDDTTATSTSGMVSVEARQTSSFGPSGGNFDANVMLASSSIVSDNESNEAMPSFELDFTVPSSLSYSLTGSTTLGFNGTNDLSTGAFYTGMSVQLKQGATTVFSLDQNTLTTDPQSFSSTGTLAAGSYVLTMSLDSGGAGGNIQGQLSGALTINGGGSSTSGGGSGPSPVPVPMAAESTLAFFAFSGVLKLISMARRRLQSA